MIAKGTCRRLAASLTCLALSSCDAIGHGFLFPGGPIANAEHYYFLIVCLILVFVIAPVLIFGGQSRDANHPHPGLYPGACSPQAWSAGAVILLVNTMIGLMPFAPRNALLADPALRDWIPELTVRNVRVGSARVALRARRTAKGHTELDVLDAGGVRIVTPGVLPTGKDRLAAGFHTMLAAG